MVNFEGYTDSNGKFTVQVPVGEYNYLISKQGYVDKNGMITVNGETNVDVTLDGSGTGTLTVHTYRDYRVNPPRPAPHSLIRIKYGSVELTESTDDNGAYVLENVPLGAKVTCMLLLDEYTSIVVDMDTVEITGDNQLNLYELGHNKVQNIKTSVKNKQNGDDVGGVFCRVTATEVDGSGEYDIDEIYTIDSTGKMIHTIWNNHPIDVKFRVFDSTDYGPGEIKQTITEYSNVPIDVVAEVMPKTPLMEVTVLKEHDLTPISNFPVHVPLLDAEHYTNSEGKAYFTVPFDDKAYYIDGGKEIDGVFYEILGTFQPTREDYSVSLIAAPYDERDVFEEVCQYINADTGEPILGLHVECTIHSQAGDETIQLDTVSEGRITIGNLHEGSRVILYSPAQRIYDSASEGLKEYEATELDIITIPSRVMHVIKVQPKKYNVTVTCDGYTTKDEYNRLEGATVYCRVLHEDDGDYDLYTGITDGMGQYEFVNLPVGIWEFQASHPDYMDSSIETIDYRINKVQLRLFSKTIGGTIVYGHVLGETDDRDYKPITNGKITVTGTEIRTGETITANERILVNGSFNVPRADLYPPLLFALNQDVTIEVDTADYDTYTETVHLDENFNGETILLNRTHRQVVFNTMFANQEVAANVPVKITNTETGKVYTGNTDNNGVWSIPLLSRGTVESEGYIYDIEYSYPDYPEQSIKRIWVYGDENDDPLRFPLYIYDEEDTMLLLVEVLDFDTGYGLNNARVRTRLLDSRIYTDYYTDVDGMAVARLPRNSEVRVSVAASGYTGVYQDVLTGDEDEKDVHFRLHPVKVGLTFTVTDNEGNPITDAHITGNTLKKI